MSVSPSSYSTPPQGSGPVCRFAHDAMATTFEVVVAGQDRDYARQAADAAFEELDLLEGQLSRFSEYGDVAQINVAEPGERVPVSAAVFECLALAAHVRQDTRGAFEVNFRGSIPYDLELHEESTEVWLLSGGIDLDLGGIGKGYALDRMVELLREWGIESGLVHSGQSTVFAMGDAEWDVGLRDPGSPDALVGRVRLREAALAGSGMQIHGAHIVDTRMQRPAEGTLAAWAMAPTAGVADALSTAFMVMTLDEIDAYCQTHDAVGARLHLADGSTVAMGHGFG